jgi:uncharacterized protein
MTRWQTILWVLLALTVVAGLFGYMGWRLIGPSRLKRRARQAAWTALVLIAVLVLTRPALARAGNGGVVFVLKQISGFATGFLAFSLLLLLLRDALWLLARAGDALLRRSARRRMLPHEPHRRAARLHASGIAVLGASMLLLAIGYVGARSEPVLERVALQVPGLAAGLDGYRIVQITDVHLGGVTTGEDFARLVDRVNALDPDLIAVTGDLGEAPVADVGADARPLQRLKARDGIYFVPGNHEVYAGVDEWVALVRALGATVLLNEHRLIQHDASRLLVAGVPNPSDGMHGTPPGTKGIAAIHSDPAEALRGAPPADFKLLLVHQPSSADLAQRAGFDLMLAGHTHGGQFFPWNYVAGLAYRFVRGLGRLDQLQVYVSRGVGVYVAPVRLGIPPELTLLVLQRAGPTVSPK